MPQFAVNPQRLDPYEESRFQVVWDGRVVPGISRVTRLAWSFAPGLASSEPGAEEPTGPFGLRFSGLPLPSLSLPSIPGLPSLPDPLGIFGRREEEGEPEPEPGGARVGVRPAYQPVRLVRGRTHDTAFEAWAAEVVRAAEAEEGATSATKDVVVRLLNEAGQPVLGFRLVGCVPIEYEPLCELDANATDRATEALTLAYTRFDRDVDIAEPVEPSFEPPG